MSKVSFINRFVTSLREKSQHVWAMFGQSDGNSPIVSVLVSMGVFVFMLIYTVERAGFPFYHDSLYYWELGNSFYSNNHFSFINFGDELRGYLFPFLLFITQFQAGLFGIDSKLLFAFYSALYFTFFTIYIAPWSFDVIFRWKTTLARRLIFALLVFFFWRGHFLYPLTDFPALTALMIASAIFAYVAREQKNVTWAVLVGFFAGAAMNIRPAYQSSFFIIFIFSIIGWYRLGLKKMISGVVLLVIGCGVVLFPQWLINQTHFGSNSPLVMAKYLNGSSLYEIQLFWGLKSQKYETNIGDNYPSAGVVYPDPLALKLTKNELKEKSLQNYLKIIIRHPLDMSISYFRHAFNGLDIFHPTPYIDNVFADRLLFRLINYLIWFLFLWQLGRSKFSDIDYISLMIVSDLMAPVVLAIPTVVEVRFFLPLHILDYGVVCFGLDYFRLFGGFIKGRWQPLLLLILCTIWVMICFALSAGTMEQLTGQ